MALETVVLSHILMADSPAGVAALGSVVVTAEASTIALFEVEQRSGSEGLGDTWCPTPSHPFAPR